MTIWNLIQCLYTNLKWQVMFQLSLFLHCLITPIIWEQVIADPTYLSEISAITAVCYHFRSLRAHLSVTAWANLASPRHSLSKTSLVPRSCLPAELLTGGQTTLWKGLVRDRLVLDKLCSAELFARTRWTRLVLDKLEPLSRRAPIAGVANMWL